VADLIEVPITGGTLLFAAAGSSGPQAYTSQQVVAKATDALDDVLDKVCRLGETIGKKLSSLTQYDKEVEFGIKVTGKGKFIVAEASAEASISIKLIMPRQ
jgi:hypothetical protein